MKVRIRRRKIKMEGGEEGKGRKEGEGRERDGGEKERMRKKALTEKIEMEANLLERTRTLLSKGDESQPCGR